jgi:hypothetical protein
MLRVHAHQYEELMEDHAHLSEEECVRFMLA